DDCEQYGACGRNVGRKHAAYGDAIDLLGERHQFFSQPAALWREEDIHFLAIVTTLAAHDITEPLHRLEGRESRWFHDTGLFAQSALGHPVALPEDAKKCTMPNRICMRRKAHLQRAHARTCGIFDQMPRAITRSRFPPVTQDRLCAGLWARHGKAT